MPAIEKCEVATQKNGNKRFEEKYGYGHQGMVIRLSLSDEIAIAHLVSRLKRSYDEWCAANDCHQPNAPFEYVHVYPEEIENAINFLSKCTKMDDITESDIFKEEDLAE